MQNLWHKVDAQQMILAKQPMRDPRNCHQQPWVSRVTLHMLADPTPGVQAHSHQGLLGFFHAAPATHALEFQVLYTPLLLTM